MYHTTNNTTSIVGLSTATVIEKTVGECSTLTTLELVYPRYIHSEFMTHRMFSRNASSSRATPVAKMIQEVCDHPVIPTEIYKNCKGMQGKELCDNCDTDCFRHAWETSIDYAVLCAKSLNELGIHKQHINRILEPFQFIRVIVTATEWDNFFKLRDSDMAQPEIRDLARAMKCAMDKPFEKLHNWSGYHIPYITNDDINDIDVDNTINDIGRFVTGFTDMVDDVLTISSARCARVSYLKHDGTPCDIDKDIDLGLQLRKDGHMSPLEHQAVRMENKPKKFYANFKGFKSYRYAVEHNKFKGIY